MTSRIKIGFAVALAMAFVGLFIYAEGFGTGGRGAHPSKNAAVAIKGNFEHYTYAITELPDKPKKLAQFDPSLPSDDTVLVGVLKALAKDGCGVTLGPEVQPVVETIGEANFVTFRGNQSKVLFELFRNSGGQVGSVRFWAE